MLLEKLEVLLERLSHLMIGNPFKLDMRIRGEGEYSYSRGIFIFKGGIFIFKGGNIHIQRGEYSYSKGGIFIFKGGNIVEKYI
jgi:hypothetical protein